ncbi:unnamed protein product [Penicillium nalgiovense]|nr:unnamed protein product [Penicillium nalgiovense]
MDLILWSLCQNYTEKTMLTPPLAGPTLNHHLSLRVAVGSSRTFHLFDVSKTYIAVQCLLGAFRSGPEFTGCRSFRVILEGRSWRKAGGRVWCCQKGCCWRSL